MRNIFLIACIYNFLMYLNNIENDMNCNVPSFKNPLTVYMFL